MTTVLEPYTINPDGIHGKIKLIPRFVVWDLNDLHTTGKNKGKPTKKPLQTDGQAASTRDSKTWCTSQEALAASAEKGYGIGYVCNDYSIPDSERWTWESGQVFVDLDDCILPDGTLTEWAQPTVEVFTKLKALIEYSPSRKGLHIFCKGRALRTGRKEIAPEKRELSLDSKEGIEVYDHTSARYATMTGHILSNGDPEVDGQDALDWLFYQFWDDNEQYSYKPGDENNSNIERTPVEAIDLEELKRLLADTPADDEYEWLVRVGYGLKGAAKAATEKHEIWDKQFFDIWDTWSAKSAKYIPGECATRWRGRDFQDTRSGISTVYKIAEKYGNIRKPTNKRKNTKLKREPMDTNSETNSESTNTADGASQNGEGKSVFKEARESLDKPGVPQGFRLATDGVYQFNPAEAERKETKLSIVPAWVEAKNRNPSSADWGFAIVWIDEDAVTHRRHVPYERLTERGAPILTELSGEGLLVKKPTQFLSYIMEFKTDKRYRTAKNLGWNESVDLIFITPNAVLTHTKTNEENIDNDKPRE